MSVAIDYMNGDTVLWEAGLYICQVQVIYSFESVKLY